MLRRKDDDARHRVDSHPEKADLDIDQWKPGPDMDGWKPDRDVLDTPHDYKDK